MDFKEELKNKIKEVKPKLSDSSINLYIRNLEKLNNSQPFKNLNFLKNTENILSKLDKYKDNTKRTYLISIVSSLTPFKDKLKKIYKIYYDKMVTKATEIESQPKNEKTEKQKENWMSMDEVQGILSKLKEEVEIFKNSKNITQEQFNKLLEYLILSLYVLIPPRRNMDYICMNIVKVVPNDTNYNYVDLTNNKFIFNKYKTSKTYKEQTIDIPKDLLDIILLFLKVRKIPITKSLNVPLLVSNSENKNINNSNYITKVLNKIFGKKIGVSMLRHIYLSSKYGDVLDEMKKDAKNMGHSTEQAKDYIVS